MKLDVKRIMELEEANERRAMSYLCSNPEATNKMRNEFRCTAEYLKALCDMVENAKVIEWHEHQEYGCSFFHPIHNVELCKLGGHCSEPCKLEKGPVLVMMEAKNE